MSSTSVALAVKLQSILDGRAEKTGVGFSCRNRKIEHRESLLGAPGRIERNGKRCLVPAVAGIKPDSLVQLPDCFWQRFLANERQSVSVAKIGLIG